MKIGRTTALLAIYALSGIATRSACAQGDPQRAFDTATAAARKPGTSVRIDLIGDSTQTDNAGYGRGFCANLTPQVDCVNMARGGASTHTYRDDGIWTRALTTRPDYMVIQFGHNDAVDPKNPLPRQTPLPDYIANLKRFITEARAAGIKPVLCTPLTRRYFQADGKIHSDLTEYSDAMKSVAHEMNVPLIDLQDESIAYLDRIGEAEGTKLGITKKDTDGSTIPDKTHLNWAGSYVFGRMVAVGLGAAVPGLKKYVRPEAAKLPPEGEKAMRIFEGGPAKIVLVGDSTVAIGGGWGPGFCADFTAKINCVDVALNGRSTKSYIDEGAWKKALDEHGDYYLIQFGHNDQKPAPAVHADADGAYSDNLRRMVADVRGIGGIPVIVTSLSRRNYKDGVLVEDLTPYVQAAKRVAAEEYITCIDLNQMSTAMLKHMTQQQADRFDKDVDPETGLPIVAPAAVPDNVATTASGIDKPATLDRTHLNPYGQKVFGRMVADNLVRTLVELGPDLIGVPAAAPSAITPTAAVPQNPAK
jgi:lysophospholipase L1-like esterase